MKASFRILLNLLFIMLYISSYSQADSLNFNKISGFSHPESVVWDKQNDQLFISNIGGDAAGDGFISRVGIGGDILELKWISGLNDPKGLLVHNGDLFVTDNTEVVVMNISKGEITKTYTIETAEFLNDLTIASEGSLYISDTGKSSIFSINAQGEVSEFLRSEDLESPNGLLMDGDTLFVAAWGSQQEKGNFLRINVSTKEIDRISRSGVGNLDGLQRTEGGAFYISDWMSGKIHRIDTTGEIREVVTSAKSVGDILLLEEEELLVLPMNLQNEVWWYKLEH